MTSQPIFNTTDSVTDSCEYDSNCSYPILPRMEYNIAEEKEYKVCRTHKKEIDKLNVSYIGICEWPDDNGDACLFPPLAMVGPPDSDGADKIAVCRRHRAVSRRLYASRRSEKR